MLPTQFYRLSINLNDLLAEPASLFARSSLFDRVISRLAVFEVGGISRLMTKAQDNSVSGKISENTLWVTMLARLFPDAFCVWIERRAAEDTDSLVAGWHAVDEIDPILTAMHKGHEEVYAQIIDSDPTLSLEIR